MSNSVCVVGSFMMDLVASAPRRPIPGETLAGTDFAIHLGGKGFNQAVAASRAGVHTSMVGLLGEDEYGSSFRRALEAERIDHRWVTVREGTGTGVGLPVLEPDGQNSIIVVPRANSYLESSHVERASDVIAAADVLLLQLELPTPAVLAAARVARASKTTVMLNPAPATRIPRELMSLVDVLTPNEVELLALAGRVEGEEVDDTARRLQDLWEIDVVVTLGARGSLVLGRDAEPYEIPAVTVDALDTVGAGDTFCGYLGAGIASGCSLIESARRANVAAAIAVTRSGAAESVPTMAEVDAAIQRGVAAAPERLAAGELLP